MVRNKITEPRGSSASSSVTFASLSSSFGPEPYCDILDVPDRFDRKFTTEGERFMGQRVVITRNKGC